MNNQRRNVLKSGSGAALLGMLAAAGIINPGMALADWTKAAFDAKSMADTLKALGVAGTTDSKDVQVTGPDIAENGAVVPMTVATTLPNVKEMLLIVEKNPAPLVALFNVSPEVEANFATRAKMGQSSDVYAVAVTTDGKALYAKKEVKVTLGGCGG